MDTDFMRRIRVGGGHASGRFWEYVRVAKGVGA